MKLTNHSSVPVYTISGSTSRPLPEWLARKRKRSLKNDPEYASRVELLQDFGFEEASQCIRVSEDGQWVMSTGTYKPQIHTHYLPHLSLSFARHTVSLNTTFLLLSSDYSKSIHLQADRSIEFHTPQGCHYTTRIPRYGRDLKYDQKSTEALIPSAGVNENGFGEVFRLNLELGRYMRGYEVEVGGDDMTRTDGGLQGGVGIGSVNTAAIAEESHGLLAFGTSLGTVELWDPRSRDRAGVLYPPWTDFDGMQEITCLAFHRSGLTLATGSSGGLVHLYDLRSPTPHLKKDQGYGFPIQDIIYLTPSTEARGQSSEPRILSSDKRIIKIWDGRNGQPWTSVEPAVDLHSVAWCKDSGMLLTANEGQQQHSFFIPQLGPAPKWCSFLDNLVEEMAEDPNDPNAYTTQRVGEVYDNYKFLTMEQLAALNLSHLVGTTTLLRPYMHGFFVAQRLYEEAKMIADPFVWEEQRAKKIKDKVDKERETRIRGNKNTNAKVNKKLAEKILEREDKLERRRARKLLEDGQEQNDVENEEHAADSVQTKPGNLLKDPRFAKLFQDEDFTIDETSHEYRLLNPSTAPTEVSRPKEKGLTAVEEELLDRKGGSSEGSLDGDDGDDDDDDSAEEKGRKRRAQNPRRIARSENQPSRPRMTIRSAHSQEPKRDRSFGSRAIQARKVKEKVKAVVGEREMTFAPEKKGTAPRIEPKAGRHDRARRSASGNVFRRM